jgi:hypothetical protein
VNGLPFVPFPSPEIGEMFWNVPTAKNARFVCKTAFDAARVYEDGFARLEFQDGSDREQVRLRVLYMPHPENELPVPSGERIRRVIGRPDILNYLIGGATYKPLEHYLNVKFSKSFPASLKFSTGVAVANPLREISVGSVESIIGVSTSTRTMSPGVGTITNRCIERP